MKAHDKLRDITHQIVKPVVNSCQNVNWFIVVSEKHRKEADIGLSITTDVFAPGLDMLLDHISVLVQILFLVSNLSLKLTAG